MVKAPLGIEAKDGGAGESVRSRGSAVHWPVAVHDFIDHHRVIEVEDVGFARSGERGDERLTGRGIGQSCLELRFFYRDSIEHERATGRVEKEHVLLVWSEAQGGLA